MTADVFVFNPFAEGYIARGKGFAPVKHQAKLAEDLANLPQFLCRSGDIVLTPKPPSASFLDDLNQAGFPRPEFVTIKAGRIDPASNLFQRDLGGLRPWAWGPDSVNLFAPLFGRVTGGPRAAHEYFNDDIARLYSKAWGACFLKMVLGRFRGTTCPGLCSEQEAGTTVDTLEDALDAIAAIRSGGHLRVIVKEAYGSAGHNAIRLWEPEISPAQRHWLVHGLEATRKLVVEPWLERELDFSVQLEMGSCGLMLCGYTGLINDRKGQFLANWAEPDYSQCLPEKTAGLLNTSAENLLRVYGEVFSLLEAELQQVGFVGPLGIDAFIYRTRQGECRLKPVVEINPRCTMGRLTLELMKHTSPGRHGLFRLITRAQARAKGCPDLSSYAHSLVERFPLQCEAEESAGNFTGPPDGCSCRGIRQGFLCLNDPEQAQVCLATFEVGRTRQATR